MPIILWDKLCNENDLKYLLKNGELDDRAVNIYEKLQDSIIDTFGISDNMQMLLAKKKKAEILYHDILVNGNKFKQLQLNVLESEIEQLEKKQPKGDVITSIIAIEKNMGFKIDYKTLTIREFYNYSNFLSKLNEKQKEVVK
jgi:hypothetical protein